MDQAPDFSNPDQAGQLQRLLQASRFATEQFRKNPGLLQELLDSGDLQRSYSENELFDALGQALEDCESNEELFRQLRLFRRREMLRILWRDFNRIADTMETTRDTSLLAESCIEHAQAWCHRELVARHGEPRGPHGEPQKLLVIAMGKLGARELNLSSDIDLIFTYPDAGNTDGSERPLSNQEFFIKLGQKLIAALDQTTADGFVFRVDMRLRPYGASGALVLNFSAMEEYYQDQGRDWERYAMIKARIVSGDQRRGSELTESLRPFVFRRYIDFGVIDSLRSMKEMINSEVRRRGLQSDVKLGHGGIREVEFIAQCFQLIRGGRSPALRRRELLPVLDACVTEGCLPLEAAEELKAAYLFLRNSEHAIQGFEDKQTQALPEQEEARAAFLVAMDYPHWDSYMQALDAHRGRVSGHFADLIADEDTRPEESDLQGLWSDDLEPQLLQELGYDDAAQATQALLELRDSARLRHLQVESRERLDRFAPRLIISCAGQPEPTRTLLRLLPLVQAIARRSAYLMLLLENPAALQELVQLCAASPWISELLARHPVLLDELLDVRVLYSAPDRDALRHALQQQVSRLPEEDLEANMDALRYFKAAQLLHVAASEVTGRLPLMQVSDKLSFLAEVILEQAVNLAWHDLVVKHGEPARSGEGRGFIVLGYGKLGGIELGHGSDLDLVFLYDSTSGGSTDGERPLESSVFYTRLGQRIIHILDARTAMGQLYEIDMRLRPSGNSGMLVSSLKAFKDYQMESAWTWEHQALVRARYVAGDAELGQEFEALRCELLARPRDESALAAEVLAMRNKMRDHLLPAAVRESGDFHLKHGEGGIVDVEFMVQFAVLAWAHQYPALARWSDNVRILQTLHSEGLFSAQESQALIDAYLSLRSVSHQQALQQKPGIVEAHQLSEERRVVTAKWVELLHVRT
jgi:glutamate-ammonia-ligase adenylyltransferase